MSKKCQSDMFGIMEPSLHQNYGTQIQFLSWFYEFWWTLTMTEILQDDEDKYSVYQDCFTNTHWKIFA